MTTSLGVNDLSEDVLDLGGFDSISVYLEEGVFAAQMFHSPGMCVSPQVPGADRTLMGRPETGGDL